MTTREVEWVASFPRLREWDRRWYEAERILCGAAFLAMSLIAAVSVVGSIFSTRWGWYCPAGFIAVTFLATRTYRVTEGKMRIGYLRSIAVSVGIGGGLSGIVYAYIKVFPGGFLWAHKLGLVMMLWVALLGASLATYERAHLSLDMGEKLWPRKILHLARAAAHAITTGFCVVMLLLTIRIVLFNYTQGTEIEGNAWLPKWVAVLVMPYTFAALGLRFLGQTVTIATKTEEPAKEQIPT